ncbi:hypothetical protein QCN29_26770 [Streptomyces sp. HNM0663]|uniref:Uncharacterized protein n=1 Tax=Streptomyces chengmaiensis TaxID=3040919 RepID=A0ABT6HUQ4_9ACTN|nr:hypothetical protein [Streptomyces chengmaiensis]MDH2392315.1 hypothetical protein [Streptomyces chengmaiensis]
MQNGPGGPDAKFRVRWKQWAGWSDWTEAIDAPRMAEGCLIVKTSPARVVWIPVHTICGPIEIEGI